MKEADAMDIQKIEQKYCSQGDTSARHQPKKYFSAGDGCFLFDDIGTKYLDMQMYNSAANFGYRNQSFEEALVHQMKQLPSLSGEYMCEAQVLLAEKICSYMEQEHGVKGRVHFSVGGAQAVDDALKIIASSTGTRNVFTFEGAYHGRTMAASSISSSNRYHKQFGSVVNTYRLPFPCCTRCPYEKARLSCNLFCVRQFERLFESEYYGVFRPNDEFSEYRAFFAEPLLGRCGYVMPPKEYFGELQKLLRKHHIYLAFDEIQMGFYRTGKMWAFENFNVTPDMFTFGKAITNGLWPLSGVWAREEIISPERWPCGSSHSTFSGNPIAMSLGLAAMEITASSHLQNQVVKNSRKFETIISQLKEDYPIIGRADCCGMASGLELVDSISKRPDSVLTHRVAELALTQPISIGNTNYGLILSVGGVFENAFLLSPSLFIKEHELELFNKLIRHYLNLALG